MVGKLAFFLVLTLSVLTFPGIADAQDENSWLGKYEQITDGINATGTRSYTEFYFLEVKKEQDKTIATYESGENSDTYQKMMLTVEIKGATAFFYYDHCLKKDDTDESCDDSPNKQGDLMFKISKSVGKNKKPILLTYGEKNDLLPKGKVFFKRVQSFE